MSDDKMSEGMAEFWAEVRDHLPILLQKETFVTVGPSLDPDDIDISTVWWNGNGERIASLYMLAKTPGQEDEEDKFNLLVVEPGTGGRTLADVDAKRVAGVIAERAADQVRQHLPGAWSTGRDFVQDEAIIATFDDVGSETADMSEFVEYVLRQSDRLLARKALAAVVDLLFCEEVPFTATSFPLLGLSTIALPTRNLRIDTARGRATVSLFALDGRDLLASVDITMGWRGVHYSFCAMEDLIYKATRRGR